MKKTIHNKNNLKKFVIILVFGLCVLSVISARILIPAVFSIIIILCLYFFNILHKTDTKQKESEIEELLLLTVFFCVYSVYSMSSLAVAGVLTPLLLFLVIAACLLFLDIFRGINVFFLSKRKEIFFRVSNPKSKSKIIFLGDSIITNQGVRDPKKSLEGLLMEEYPDADITSIAMNGLTTRGLLKLIKSEKPEHYTVAVISTGGNDISILRRLKTIKKDLAKLLDEVGKMADNIIFIFSYDVGRAPFFSKTILASAFSKFYTRQSEKLIGALLDLKKTREFLLLNLNDPSLGEDAIKKFYDVDFLHPNEEGYRRLYEQISALFKKRHIKM